MQNEIKFPGSIVRAVNFLDATRYLYFLVLDSFENGFQQGVCLYANTVVRLPEKCESTNGKIVINP